MSNLIAALIVAVCLPNSDACEIDVPHVWKQLTPQDLHECAAKAQALVEFGEDARCEVAYSYSIDDQANAPIRDLADRAAIEQYLAPLKE